MKFLKFICYLTLALLAGYLGLALPVYFTALDVEVLKSSDAQQPRTLGREAEALTLSGHPTAAAYLLGDSEPTAAAQAAELLSIPTYPVWDAYLRQLPENRQIASTATHPLLTREARRMATRRLAERNQPPVLALLSTRDWEEWIRMKPISHPAGIPLDISILLSAFLAAERVLSPSFLNELVQWTQNPTPENIAQLEIYYSSLTGWAQLMPFDALALVMGRFSKTEDFFKLAGPDFRKLTDKNTITRALLLGIQPPQLLAYLEKYPSTGIQDLRQALTTGPTAVDTLLRIHLPLRSDLLLPASVPLPEGIPLSTADLVRDHPREMLAARIGLLLVAFYFLFTALSSILPNPGDRFLARPTLWQRTMRRTILASVPTIALLLFLEPSLLQQPSPVQTASILRLDSKLLSETATTTMKDLQIDNVTLLILLIFFFLQVGLYLFCLVKLSEIRRQNLPDNVKLQLLDNEDNLFDGGLYLGLGGTVASLIFLAMGVVEASLMAAYASTLFGILFVSFLKIFHLRPLRRRLILASEI